MNASTTIFQHHNIAALMVTGTSPRFEIVVDGQVAQTIPATRAWRAEQKAAVAAAQLLAGVAPVAVVVAAEAQPAPVAPVAVVEPKPAKPVQIASRLHTVQSSCIAQVGYSALREELTVVFTSGQTFIFKAVTMAEFNRLRRARSVGKAYHTIIRGKKAGFPVATVA